MRWQYVARADVVMDADLVISGGGASPPCDPYSRDCPSRQVLDRIGDKWTVLVLGELGPAGARRFTMLRKRLAGVSEKMLTQTLRGLERDGLVLRTVYPAVPPHVEYQLTPLGETLREPLEPLRQWSVEHVPEILAARACYDQSRQAPSGIGGPTTVRP